MSHSDLEMRSESVGLWLPLVEYSIKSGVSLSTIRRRIKTNSIPFKLEKGKYLIRFDQADSDGEGRQDQTLMEAEQPTSQNYSMSQKDAQDIILRQEVRIRQLEQELDEMALLIQTLEQKYGIRY